MAGRKTYSDADVVFETSEQRNSRAKHPVKKRTRYSDDELASEEEPTSIEPTTPPANSFVSNEDGSFQPRTMTGDERKAGAALGALEFPLMGFNDEIMGSTNALINQGTHAAAGGAVEAAKQFGIDPNAAAHFLGYDPNYKPETMAEGREAASQLKDRYAKARESGEIGFWDKENLASNAGNVAASVLPYEGIYNASKVLGNAAYNVGKGALGLSSAAVPGWGSTLFGLGATGATATALTEAGNAVGTPEERVQQVVKAGGGPLVVGAMLNIIGAGVGKGIGAGAGALKTAMTPAAKAAYRRLAELANDAGISIDDIAKSFDENAALKPEATLAEAGPNWFRGWQSEAGDVARSPGTADVAARTLLERQKGATTRMQADAEAAFETAGAGFKLTGKQLEDQAKLNAKPLYDQAYKVQVKPSPELEQYMNSPTGREALQDAIRIADIDNVPVQEIIPIDVNGQIVGYPTVLLDYMQRAMRSKATKAFTAGDGEVGHAFKNWRDGFLNIVDKMNPTFQQARKAYAGPQANKDAMELGRSLIDQDPKWIANQLNSLSSETEKQFFKQGYGQKLIEEIRKTPYGGNPGYKMTNSTAREQGAEAVLGEGAWTKLQRQAQLEDRMTQTVNEVAANSKTAQRILHHEDSNAQTIESLEMLEQIAHQGTAGLVQKVGMGGIAGWLRHVQKAKRNELAKMLFTNDPAKVKEALVQISKEVPWADFWKKLGEKGTAASSGLVTSSGQPLAQQFSPQGEF